MAAFLFGLSVVLALLALHPFVTFPWSLKLLRRFRRVSLRPQGDATLRCAICVCAYNEAAIIADKLENLRALRARHPDLEVLLYIDGSSDATPQIAAAYADEFFIHHSRTRHGKTYGMNLLVAQAKAPLLVFSDANVMLDLDVLDQLQRYFRDPTVGCVCGQLSYVNATAGATAANGSKFWQMEEQLKRLESDVASAVSADGSLFAIRRILHRPPPNDIIDDMYVSLSVVCGGFRMVQADDVCAYEQTVTASDEEFRRKARIACQSFNVNRLLWPQLRRLPPLNLYIYVSHKLLRWFIVYLLTASGLCFLLALLTAGHGWLALLLLLLGGAGLWAGIRLQVKPVMRGVDMLCAFAGVGLGVWQSLRGERYQTWAPANSIRQPVPSARDGSEA